MAPTSPPHIPHPITPHTPYTQVVRIMRVIRDARNAQEAARTGRGGAGAMAAAPGEVPPPPDAYSVLGVAHNTPTGDIKKRYMRLSLLIHPDKCTHAVGGMCMGPGVGVFEGWALTVLTMPARYNRPAVAASCSCRWMSRMLHAAAWLSHATNIASGYHAASCRPCAAQDAHTAFQAVSMAAKTLQDTAARSSLDAAREERELRAMAERAAAAEEQARQWRVARGEEAAGVLTGDVVVVDAHDAVHEPMCPYVHIMPQTAAGSYFSCQCLPAHVCCAVYVCVQGPP